MAVAAAAQDHLATLGISEGRAKEAVFDSFMADAVSIAGKPAAFTAMAPAARVALVNFALTLARTFVESDEFKRRYADHREANGPDPLPEEQTADAIFAKQRAGFENQVAEMRKLFDQITPEQRATLEEGLDGHARAARRDGKGREAQGDRGPAEGSARRAGPRTRRGDEGVREDLPRRPARAGRHAPAPLPRRHERRRLHDAQLVDKGKNKVFADRGPRGQAGRVENGVSGRKTRHRRRPRLRPEVARTTCRPRVCK